jgi:hypothetical protein
MFSLAGICGVCSLAVDFGQARYTQKQLYIAAQTTARYAVTGLSDSTALTKALSMTSSLKIDGASLVMQSGDVQIGVWNASTSTFTQTLVSPNAVWVTCQRSLSHGNPLASLFMFGRTMDVHGSVIATYTAATNTLINVPGKANPWLAGMPNGTTANFTNQGWVDQAPSNSPILASGLNITAGAVLNLTFTGSVSYYPGTQPFNPDGDPSWIIDNYYATANGNAEHGIANINAPLTSVIGVFLDDTQPDSSAAPAMLNFSSPASLDFASISPQLKQPFFIGDGFRADGVTPQNFVVPAGATRFYIGVMDGQQWSDNSGSLATTVVKPATISTVHYAVHP